MTRQRIHQLANMARGYCAKHKDRPLSPHSAAYCNECLQDQRERAGWKGREYPVKAQWEAVTDHDLLYNRPMVRALLGVSDPTIVYQCRKRGLERLRRGRKGKG